MKALTLKLVLLLLFAVLIAGCGNPTPSPASSSKGAPASPGTNITTAKSELTAPTNEIVMHKAVFARLPGAKDPFFPATSRVVESQATNQALPRPPLSSLIKLTGFRPIKTRPLAMINQTFFEPGERGEISIAFTNSSGTIEVQRVRIKCLAIRGDLVEISIEGEPGVIKLSQHAAP